jgi:hypothetical protein
VEAAVREGLYWEHFDDEERELLIKVGFRPEEADALGGIDGELALLRVLVRRLMRQASGDNTGRGSEAVSRLVERLGRVLRTRQALGGGDSTVTAELFEKIGSEVLAHQRAEAQKQAVAPAKPTGTRKEAKR